MGRGYFRLLKTEPKKKKRKPVITQGRRKKKLGGDEIGIENRLSSMPVKKKIEP